MCNSHTTNLDELVLVNFRGFRCVCLAPPMGDTMAIDMPVPPPRSWRLPPQGVHAGGGLPLNKNHLVPPGETITLIPCIQRRNFAAANMRPDLGHHRVLVYGAHGVSHGPIFLCNALWHAPRPRHGNPCWSLPIIAGHCCWGSWGHACNSYAGHAQGLCPCTFRVPCKVPLRPLPCQSCSSGCGMQTLRRPLLSGASCGPNAKRQKNFKSAEKRPRPHLP